jgi:antitoxin ChpS
MYTTAIRKVGGSIMLALPRAFLEQLHLEVGSEVAMEINDHQIVIKPKAKPKYTLSELLAQCDETTAISDDEAEWFNASRVGDELI